ncbi:hypothetical protein F5Y18DRAFT_426473 [Xylariaceae sp. FL1019]|nr:hypothetical protein F5Y18DRAFT_426473 [Xylariaceae sp. FL1019]
MCELRESRCTFVAQPEARPRRLAARQTNPVVEAPIRATNGQTGPSIAPIACNTSVSSVSPGGPALTSEWLSRSEQATSIGGPSPNASALTKRVETEAFNSVGEETHRFAELYGLTSDAEPILMKHRPYNLLDNEYHLDTHGMRRVQQTDSGISYPVVFHMVDDKKAVGYVDEYSEVDAIHSLIEPWGSRLVRLYFLLVQPAYPILYQQDFMQRWSASYRNISPSLLGAVYLKAIDWWSYDSELSLRESPDTTKLRNLTLQAIERSYHRPRLSSIASLLIFLHCTAEEPLTPSHTFLRSLTAQMLAVAEAIGLHLDASEWSIPSWEKALRKRLSWAIYMQDIWTALAYGRPSSIKEDNWVVRDLEDEDFDDCNDNLEEVIHAINVPPSAGTVSVTFRLMVDLSKILTRIVSTFYTIRSSVDQDTCRLLEKAQPLLAELNAWQATLVTSLPLTTSQPRRLSSRGYVYLCYYGLAINISRRLVRSTALAPLCSDPAILFTIRQQASQIAVEATNFVSSLRLDQLESFWYFPSPYLFALIGSFQVLLLVTSVSATERDYWREMLTSYLWTSRVMSKASSPLKYAVNRLEGGVLRGMEHALAVNVDSQLPAAADSSDLVQLLQQLESEQFAYSDFADIGMGLQAFDWLHGVQI